MPGPGGAPLPGPGPGATPFGDPSAAEDDNVFVVDLEPQVDLPNGDYEVQITNIKKSISNAENPMIIWGCVVTDGPHAGTDIAAFTAITPDSQWKITETILAFGLADPEKDKTAVFKDTDAIGRSAIATVEKSAGFRPSIKAFRPHPRGPLHRKGGLTPEGTPPGVTTEEATEAMGEAPPF